MTMSQDEATRLHELQTRVTDLEKQLAFVLQHLQLKYVDPGTPDPAMAAVLDWLRKGNQIEAIKAYRVATNAGLAEAKDAVEKLGQANGLHFLKESTTRRF
jgi:ribosomal protein L7/L12